jgi:hypothetical protein
MFTTGQQPLMFINKVVEDSSPNSLKKTKFIYYKKRAVVDHSYSDNLNDPFAK